MDNHDSSPSPGETQGVARKLKRVALKEELVELTGDFVAALLLQQLLYWQERTNDIDRYIAEETERAAQGSPGESVHIEPTHGWIYKSAAELAEETLLVRTRKSGDRGHVTDATIRSYLTDLEESGWIASRKNPRHKWDRTWQYRVNVATIISGLQEIGFEGLPGWTMASDHRESKDSNSSSKTKDQSEDSKDQSEENSSAISESTSEITSESSIPESDESPSENGRDKQQDKPVSPGSYGVARLIEIITEAKERGWAPDPLPEDDKKRLGHNYKAAFNDGYPVETLDNALWWLVAKASGKIDREKQAWAYLMTGVRAVESGWRPRFKGKGRPRKLSAEEKAEREYQERVDLILNKVLADWELTDEEKAIADKEEIAYDR